MREKIVKLYSYDELNEEAQAKAREWFGRVVAEDYEADCVLDDAATLAALMGLDIRTRKTRYGNGSTGRGVSICYSLYSQGAGACFEGNWNACKVQPGKAIAHAPQDAELARIASEFERIATLRPNTRAAIANSGRGEHENSARFDIDTDPPEDTDDIARSSKEWEAIRVRESVITEELAEVCRDFMRWIYRRILSDYDWQTDAEQLAEGIRANEYEFTEDGKRGS